MNRNGEFTPTAFTALDGKWRVAVLLGNGAQYAITDPNKYASEAAATIAAKQAAYSKLSLSYVVVRS